MYNGHDLEGFVLGFNDRHLITQGLTGDILYIYTSIGTVQINIGVLCELL